MKKSTLSTRKLTLNRDTLRSLNASDLDRVDGGVTNASCDYSCDPVSVRVCPASKWVC